MLTCSAHARSCARDSIDGAAIAWRDDETLVMDDVNICPRILAGPYARQRQARSLSAGPSRPPGATPTVKIPLPSPTRCPSPPPTMSGHYASMRMTPRCVFVFLSVRRILRCIPLSLDNGARNNAAADSRSMCKNVLERQRPVAGGGRSGGIY